MPDAPTAALKFMILDDEIIVALDMESILNDLGHCVVGTANRMDRGMEIARSAALDLAILAINVRGVLSFPIAKVLWDRGVTVIFSSGYGQRGLTGQFRDAQILRKPFKIGDQERTIAAARANLVRVHTV
jgi:two-component SAPR family response regulator